MIAKERTVSLELQIFRVLKNRMALSEKESTYFTNLEKGYEGEVKFDEVSSPYLTDCIVLKDLLLEVTNNIFQIDSLVIFKDTVLVFEIKNYEANFYVENTSWYSLQTRKEINNPVLQLQRSETLLRKYFHTNRFPLPLESKIIFINRTFTLYQARIDLPAVFPTQLHYFLSTLSTKRGKLTDQHFRIAKQLCADHITVPPYSKIPTYDYASLRKGIVCGGCGRFYETFREKLLHCTTCGNIESVELALLRSVHEYHLLFPNKKITSKAIQEWCSIIPSRRLVRLILDGHLISVGTGRSTYYVYQ